MTEEEGGRHKPFVSNYRPQFFIRTADVTGTITLPEGLIDRFCYFSSSILIYHTQAIT